MVEKIASDRIRSRLNVHSANSQKKIAMLVPDLRSVLGPGCVKTRSSQGCTELFSQSPSSDRSCQCNWFPHRRNRDGNSTRKLNVRVFTQPRSKTEVAAESVCHPTSDIG